MKNPIRFILGIFVILLGINLLFNQFGIGDFFLWDFLFSNLWFIFLTLLGVVLLYQRKVFVGLLFLFLGLSVGLDNFLDVSVWNLIWPLAIIFLGLTVLFGKKVMWWHNDNDSTDTDAFFWGAEKKITKKDFKEAKINCIFGGVEYDMSRAGMAKSGAELEIFCLFGGVEVRVPKDIEVISTGSGFFGGWEENLVQTEKAGGGKLKISGLAVFGGVEIKN